MDKYDLVLDIIEHPLNYTADNLTELLSDPETREIYNLLCKTESAVEANKSIDVDAEWENFGRKHTISHHRYFNWFGSRAASITAIIGTSIVAVAAGIVVTIAVSMPKSESMENNIEHAEYKYTLNQEKALPHILSTDSIPEELEPIQFENEPLENIMETIARIYNVSISFSSKELTSLHLYYKLDPVLTLDEVISQLNTFEQINITRNGNTLTID